MIAVIDFTNFLLLSWTRTPKVIGTGPSIVMDFNVNIKTLGLARSNRDYFWFERVGPIREASDTLTVNLNGIQCCKGESMPYPNIIPIMICDVCSVIKATYPDAIIRLVGLNRMHYSAYRMLPKTLREVETRGEAMIGFLKVENPLDESVRYEQCAILNRRDSRIVPLLKALGAKAGIRTENEKDIVTIFENTHDSDSQWNAMSMLIQALETLKYDIQMPYVYDDQPKWANKYNDAYVAAGYILEKSEEDIYLGTKEAKKEDAKEEGVITDNP